MTKYKKINLKNQNDILKKILSSNITIHPRKVDKPIILYGAGSLGKMAKEFFDYIRIPFLYVIDKNADKYKSDEYWSGIKIIHPDEVKEMDKKNCLLLICVVTTPIVALRNQLIKDGWKDVVPFYDVSQYYKNKYPINNGWSVNKFNNKEKDLVKKVFNSLSDNISRSYYLRFLAWRKLRAEILFDDDSINNDNRFFIPEILNNLNKNEVFVDCGAHKGSVTEKFLKFVKNKYKAVYAIEPDTPNYKILREKLKNKPDIKIIQRALSDKNGKEKFEEGFDFLSKLTPKGKKLIKTIKLDSLNIDATFIKMHLEGKELDALKGSIKTIKKHRPIIVATIYHNTDGIWKTPLFLMNNIKNYKYYIRTHSWAGTGAVLYCLPEEKFK